MEERKLNRNPDDRPIKGNQTGKYNMDFIDWQNEYSNIYSNYDPNNQDDDCPIYGMDKQTFVRLMAEEFEQGEYGEDEFFEPGGDDDKLPDNYLQNIKQMKIGQTIKQCSVCVKNFEKAIQN
ncbi:hypothetical protein PPERSA_06823 [Pseudocohnilembus persalinus]|uniref:Uncharacterized protein n=1 Tax=Pseudocohnilembus persalinus TaxID=266149 RepID=A0A0V0QTF7_PSEPJ|nr:hypothetical protein PPERSA_06823 [Pseudocohnilembus persalinus]|eukprot:KRX05189.1 hypothetical protein PPERSA_06823 [Pseudocohnilembus persalinus]